MTVQEMEIPIKIISWISETVSSRKKVLLLSIVSMAISMQQTTTGDRVSQVHISVTTASHFFSSCDEMRFSVFAITVQQRGS